MTDLGLKDAVVIVTGAGGGIGRATALAFAAEGAKLVVADMNAEGANETVTMANAAGGQAVAAIGDLSVHEVVDSVVAAAIDNFGSIDVLVNNAGIMDSMAAADEISDAEWERVIRINLTAPFMLTRAVLPFMLKAGKGAIVNTASEAGLRGSAAGTAYTVSKHGVVGLTKSLAVMYRDSGIRANAIAPGGTHTNIQVNADPEAKGPRVIGAYMGNVGRMSQAEEQAAAIVFLASDAASNISGTIIPVDNGWSAV